MRRVDLDPLSGRRGVRNLVVITAGLGGSGPGLIAICRRYGMRLVGPNCFGIAVPGARLNATFAATQPQPGIAGLVMQSGGIGEDNVFAGMTVLGLVVVMVSAGVTRIREIVIVAHATPQGMMSPVMTGASATNLPEYRHITEKSLSYLQRDFKAQKFATFHQQRAAVMAKLFPDSCVTIRACRLGSRARSRIRAELADELCERLRAATVAEDDVMARREGEAGDCLCDVTGADRADGEGLVRGHDCVLLS